MLQTVLDGLAIGSTYALLAIAFTLVFGVLRRVNLAYGASIMVGIYVAIWVNERWHVGPIVLLPIVIAVTVVAGVYVERLCFAPHRHRAAVTSMAASFAVWMQLEEVSTLLLPRHANAFPSPFEFFSAAGTGDLVRADHVAALGCAAAASFGIWYLLYRTRFGLAVRAMTDHREAAICTGIDIARLSTLITLVASILGAFAGYLIVGIDTQVTPMFAMWATLKGMIAAMLGGIGSLPGAVAGGLLLGLIESHAQRFAGPQWRDLISFVLLFLVLWRCPAGLSALWRRDRQGPSPGAAP